jgi:hypothetical protein
MREDTVFGPVWLFPDFLPEKAAKHGVRLELMWPTLEGFTAMHTGPPKGGGWVVRAPMAALEKAGLPTDSASEHPVKEGTVWPPIHIPVPNRLQFKAPAIGPEELYKQTKRRRDWEDQELNLRSSLEWTYTHGGQMRPAWMQGKPPPDRTILGDR